MKVLLIGLVYMIIKGVWWIIKLSLLIMGAGIVGAIPGIILSKIKVTPIAYISLALFFLIEIGSDNKFISYTSILLFISTIVCLMKWFRSFKNVILRKSIFFEEDKFNTLIFLFAAIILNYNLNLINKYNLTYQYYVSIILCIFSAFCFSFGYDYYKKILKKANEKGTITDDDLYRMIDKSDNEKKENIDKKYHGLIQMRDNICSYTGLLIKFSGNKNNYYFSSKKFLQIRKSIQQEIISNGYVQLNCLTTLDEIPFNITDLKLFILDKMISLHIGHLNNIEIVCYNSRESTIGLCDCCKGYSTNLIKDNGQFCSTECKLVMDKSDTYINENKNKQIIELSLIPNSNRKIIELLEKQKYYMNKPSKTRHGYAAETVNSDIDRTRFRDVDDSIAKSNAKNGADRIVDGKLIQSKYCEEAKKSVNAAFKNNKYKYLNNGKPMKLEVPKDQYEEAIELLKKRIENGEVPTIKDPQEAYNLVTPGYLTYGQSKNVTKALTVDSIIYDSANATIIGLNSFGISALTIFALEIINGEDVEIAFKNALESGIDAMKLSAGTALVSSQLEKITKQITRNYKINLNINLNVVSLIVYESNDFYNYLRGYMSGKQLIKNTVSSGLSIFAGTKVGALIGGIPGIILGAATTAASKFVIDSVLESISASDKKEMQQIFENQFCLLSREYVLTKNEAKNIYDKICNINADELLTNMYYSTDQYQYASHVIIPYITERLVERKMLII